MLLHAMNRNSLCFFFAFISVKCISEIRYSNIDTVVFPPFVENAPKRQSQEKRRGEKIRRSRSTSFPAYVVLSCNVFLGKPSRESPRLIVSQPRSTTKGEKRIVVWKQDRKRGKSSGNEERKQKKKKKENAKRGMSDSPVFDSFFVSVPFLFFFSSFFHFFSVCTYVVLHLCREETASRAQGGGIVASRLPWIQTSRCEAYRSETNLSVVKLANLGPGELITIYDGNHPKTQKTRIVKICAKFVRPFSRFFAFVLILSPLPLSLSFSLSLSSFTLILIYPSLSLSLSFLPFLSFFFSSF